MNLTPKVKAQLEEQKKQCVFCKIVSKEILGKIIFEDQATLAVLDINPIVKGQTIFLLKEHYPLLSFLPPEEFKHFFGLIPQLCKAIKGSMVAVAVNVFIASGGAAGQQAPHFMVQIFPRDERDKFYHFLFRKDKSLDEEKRKIITDHFQVMMNNYFAKNPAGWHAGKGNIPSFLVDIYQLQEVIYEDEKVLCILPRKGAAGGHIEVYSKSEERDIDRLSSSNSAHLFSVASLAAIILFEGLKVQGTNLILKSGYSDDNPKGSLCLYVLPRMQNDHLQEILWQPKQPTYDLDEVMKKVKDKTWNIKYVSEEEKNHGTKKISLTKEDEIRMAIEKIY